MDDPEVPLRMLLEQRIDLLHDAQRGVINERHELYLRIFEEHDKHTARALAAQRSMVNGLLAAVAASMAILTLIAVLWRH